MTVAKQPELFNAKVNRTKAGIRGQEVRDQVEHIDSAGAKLVYLGCLVPGDVMTADTSTQARLVNAGSVIRVQAATDVFIAFGDENLDVVDATTSPGLKLTAGYHVIVATNDWMRSSAVLTRIEIVRV